jgi:hypothetical protein
MIWKHIRAAGLAFLLLPGVARAAGDPQAQGEAALTLVDYGRESAFTEQSRPAYGRFVVGHFEANTACELLLVAYDEGSDSLAGGWLPTLLTLAAEEARNAPPKAAAWPWFEPRAPFEVFAVFLPKDLPDLDELHGLIAQLGDPLMEAALAKVLAGRLRARIAQWAASSAPAAPPPKSNASLRGWEQFPWREVARKVPFAPGQPGVLVFRNPAK